MALLEEGGRTIRSRHTSVTPQMRMSRLDRIVDRENMPASHRRTAHEVSIVPSIHLCGARGDTLRLPFRHSSHAILMRRRALDSSLSIASDYATQIKNDDDGSRWGQLVIVKSPLTQEASYHATCNVRGEVRLRRSAESDR